MAFIQHIECEVCGQNKPVDVNRGRTCDDCRNKLKQHNKLEWMNERKNKTIEQRLAYIENFIYDKVIGSDPKSDKIY